jgi:hypothetical protein
MRLPLSRLARPITHPPSYPLDLSGERSSISPNIFDEAHALAPARLLVFRPLRAVDENFTMVIGHDEAETAITLIGLDRDCADVLAYSAIASVMTVREAFAFTQTSSIV